jgi:hypothetical protein
MAFNSTAAGDGTTLTLRTGTGAAPAAGAAVTGTQRGWAQRFVASTTAGKQGFMLMAKITGLTLNTAVWFDISIIAVTGGGATIQDINFVVHEVP